MLQLRRLKYYHRTICEICYRSSIYRGWNFKPRESQRWFLSNSPTARPAGETAMAPAQDSNTFFDFSIHCNGILDALFSLIKKSLVHLDTIPESFLFRSCSQMLLAFMWYQQEPVVLQAACSPSPRSTGTQQSFLFPSQLLPTTITRAILRKHECFDKEYAYDIHWSSLLGNWWQKRLLIPQLIGPWEILGDFGGPLVRTMQSNVRRWNSIWKHPVQPEDKGLKYVEVEDIESRKMDGWKMKSPFGMAYFQGPC